MRGERRDLQTLEGLAAAVHRTVQQYADGRGYRFTDADRAKGKATQRLQGRFGHGRFTTTHNSAGRKDTSPT